MNDLSAQVRDLLFRQRLSSTVIAQRLGITPREVMQCAVPPTKSENAAPEDGVGQIEFLRRRVRETLIDRIEEFPPASLVRLWQLIEDPKLLLAVEEEEDLFPIPEEIREKIFALLDGEG